MKNRNNITCLSPSLYALMSFLGTLRVPTRKERVLSCSLPVILALGLDTVVAIMIVVLGTQAGCLASTVGNPFATGIASGIAGISAGDGMGMRVLMLVVFTGLVIFIINRYADKVKAHPEKSSSSSVGSPTLSSSRSPPTRTWSCRASGRRAGHLRAHVRHHGGGVRRGRPSTRLTFFEAVRVAWIGATPVLKREVPGSDITPFAPRYYSSRSPCS